ncbi:Holliday junction branch migration protein RuvA [Bradymonas sediminis]|uniref:Holliday junction branch migration complex subunit RuvA n=1 Tax=Bradymonas sediminis TaxID=1548548 RepID=A0A2Z4FJZ8_9DELT|nr:Holliday junction branch migration protein RuvA [Bradymonas sediminis]AWV89200.1 Holliday junction branch migration protein RuvA [Bradymonas sediminis]TDP73367.1 Holliday junction DNA helicase subunit RuvA [Bradymonas sediminis]
MIASLKGHIQILTMNSLIVDVNGVGYHVHVPLGTAGRIEPEADGRASFHIHTNVREDAITLFGFATFEEKRLFMRLTSVSGIGPKMGLAVLSGLTPSDFIRAVRNSDVKALTQISGVGKKTAQRIILELKSAVDDFEFAELAPADPSVGGDMADDLRSALGNLGYRENDVEQTLENMKGSIENAADLEPLLREALKMLR